MLASWTPQQVEAMRRGIARAMDENGERVAEEDCCVNLGAPECTARAAENGWCPACWALIDPGGTT